MKSKTTEKILWIAAGGTGGHISPGAAIAIQAARKSYRVFFFTLPQNRDYPDIVEISREKKINVIEYPAPRIPKNPVKLFSFLNNLFKSWKIMRHTERPDAVLAMGGYPSFPAIFFALLRRIPLFLAEQNAYPGLITRLFAGKARKVFHSFPETLKNENDILTGNPLRKSFLTTPVKRSRKTTFPKRILLVGGSQGARDINSLYRAIINDSYFSSSEITVSTGKKEFEEIKGLARKKDRIFPFITNMPEELLRANLVVSRSGAATLYEIIWSEKPAVLLPYPFAASDHQRKNALAFSNYESTKMIDIRPFESAGAMEEMKDWIEKNFSQAQENSHLLHEKFPLAAHETIVNEITESLI